MELVTVLEGHADGPAVLHDHLRDGRLDADLRPVAARCTGDGLADAAGAALLGAPGREGPVQLTHEVVEQHGGSARRVGATSTV